MRAFGDVMIQYVHIYIIPPQSSDVEPVKKKETTTEGLCGDGLQRRSWPTLHKLTIFSNRRTATDAGGEETLNKNHIKARKQAGFFWGAA